MSLFRKKKPMDYLIEDNWYRDFNYIITVIDSCRECDPFDMHSLTKLHKAYWWGYNILNQKIEMASIKSGVPDYEIREELDIYFEQLRKKREIIEQEIDEKLTEILKNTSND